MSPDMKKLITVLLSAFCVCQLQAQKEIAMSKDALKDKIMGGWAGQTIGVTFAPPIRP